MIAAIPTAPDGVIVPRLLPVAAYLCAEDYPDESRAAALEALAAGKTPHVCYLLGLLEPVDVVPLERILSGRPPYGDSRPTLAEQDRRRLAGDPELAAIVAEVPGLVACPPISGGAPIDLDDVEPFVGDFPRRKTAADYRAELLELAAWYRSHPDAD